MCSPTLILASAVGLKAVSAVSTAYAQREQGKYAKGVAEYNARVTENEATRTRNVGTERENQVREQTAQLIGQQRAQLGASGVDIGTGTPLKLQETAETLGEVDALRVRRTFGEKATSLETQAEFTREQGKAAEQAGKQQAVGTLLSGAASIGLMFASGGVADKWFTAGSAANSGTALTPGITASGAFV